MATARIDNSFSRAKNSCFHTMCLNAPTLPPYNGKVWLGVQPCRSLQVRGRCRFLKHCKKGNRRLASPCEGLAKSQVRDRPVQAKVHGTGSPCKSVQVRVSIRCVFTGVCALAVLHERHLRWYLQESVFLLVGHAFCLVFTGVRALAAHAITLFALVFIRVRAFCS